MDPLIRFKEAHQLGIISNDVYDLVLKRFPLVVEGINRIERASGIRYPVAYVEPSLVVSSSPNAYDFGILFARTIPVSFDEKFQVVIQITALRREIDKMSKKLKPLGLTSTSRTGAIAMTRGAEVFK